MRLFSGTSNLPLAKKIAKNLGVSLGKVEIERFADSEVRVRVLENVRDEEVFVIESLSNPVNENLFELLLVSDSLKRLGAKRLVAVIPYLGYARQDRAYRKGEAVSVSVLAKSLEGGGIDKIITVDAHSQKALSHFKIPVINLSPLPVFAQKLKGKNLSIVSPDFGGIERVSRLARMLKAPVVLVEKKRDLKTGKIKTLGLKCVSSTKANDRLSLSQSETVIIDDIITSGRTLTYAACLLKEKGAKKIWVFATHADFVKETPMVLKNSPIDKIFVTDTVKLEKEKTFPKLQILTVSNLIAKNLK